MDLEKIPIQMGLSQAWDKRPDGWWLSTDTLDVEEMVRRMLAVNARFVTITARPAPEGECRLYYHWDADGQLLTFATMTHEGSITSITALCPAADWVEREVRDYFAVDFIGRTAINPLMLRDEDKPGVFFTDGGDKQ
jgi:hypothetical protein